MKKISKKVIALVLVILMILPYSVSSFGINADETSTTTRPKNYNSYGNVLTKASFENENNEDADVLLLQDNLPWDSYANETVLNNLGYNYNVICIDELSNVDLWDYKVIIIANDQSMSTYEKYREFKSKLDLFANLGGVIVYGACDGGWAAGSLTIDLPGGLKKEDDYSYNNYIVDSNHPIVTGQYTDNYALVDSDLYNNYCSHISFTESTIPNNGKVILRSSDTSRPTLVEYTYGSGIVIASGLTWEHAYDHDRAFSEKALDDLFAYAYSKANGVVSSEDKMTIGRDNNKYAHSADNFFINGEAQQYQIDDVYFDRLNSFYEESFWEPLPLTNNEIQKERVSKWGGSCYGVSVSMALAYMKDVEIANFVPNATQYYNDTLPKDNSDLRSLINYYQLSQYVPIIDQKEYYAYKSNSTEFSRELKLIVNLALQSEKSGVPFIFTMGYRWNPSDNPSDSGSAGHAIVCIGAEKTGNGYRLKFIDPNNRTDYVYANVDSDYSDINFESTYNAYAQRINRNRLNWRITRVGHSTLSIYYSIDIDGADNTPLVGASLNRDNIDLLNFTSNSKFQIVADSGKSLTFDGADLTGDIEVLDIQYNECGEFTKWQVAIESNYSYVINTYSNFIDLSINDDNNYYAFSGYDSDEISINKDGTVTASGDDMDCDVFFGVSGLNTEMIRVSSDGTDDLSIVDCGSNLELDCADAENCKVTGFYGSLIYTINGQNTEDGMIISKDNSIEVSCELSPYNIDLNYKDSYKLNPQIVSLNDYEVSYSSSNPSVVRVDENGNITALKRGTAEVTCTVTDSLGNTASDICNVNVDYSFVQWIIKILLFGWIWY